MEQNNGRQELMARQNDGLSVFLNWHREANILSIVLIDNKQTPPFATEFTVPNDKGLEAFNHPFAYMPESQTVKM